MNRETKYKKPIFQSSGADEPVKISPPFKTVVNEENPLGILGEDGLYTIETDVLNEDGTYTRETSKVDRRAESMMRHVLDVASGKAEPPELMEHSAEETPDPTTEEPVPEPMQAPEADEDVLPQGWREITQTQQDGRMYRVAYQFEEDGVQAFWRKTRVLSHNRWTMHGKWTNSLTRVTLTPQPLYYKENV